MRRMRSCGWMLTALACVALLDGCSEAEPRLEVSPGQIELSATHPVVYLVLRNAAEDESAFSPSTKLDYSVTSDVSWLRLSPAAGTSRGETDSIRVAFDPELSHGTYAASLSVRSNAGNRVIPVTLQQTATVQLLTPASGAEILTGEAHLTWADCGAESYTVYLDSSPTIGEPVATGLTTTSLAPMPVDVGRTYYWSVVAHFAGGDSQSSSTWTFSTGGETHLLAPANGAADLDVLQSLTWNATLVDSFDVFIGTTNPPTDLLAAGITETTTYARLDFGTTYYWFVRSYLPGGETRDSEVREFATVGDRYAFIENLVETRLPCLVDVMFQVVYGPNGHYGVTNLTAADFVVYENGQPVPPTESGFVVAKRDAIDYRLDTVVMLDNSTSIDAQALEEIKRAASALVADITQQQRIAIYVFSDHPELVIDFTDDVAALTAAIAGIGRGYATTDLYGAVIAGFERLTEEYSLTEVRQGVLVLMTDGGDTQGSHTLAEAVAARGDRRFYVIGLGSQLDFETLTTLANPAQCFIPASGVEDLEDQFRQMQHEIVTFANSFYWLSYATPKRGASTHSLSVEYAGNGYAGPGATLESGFESDEFFSVDPGVYINLSAPDRGGIDALALPPGATAELVATSVFGDSMWEIEWDVSDGTVVEVTPSSFDGTVATIRAIGAAGRSASITVRDVANGFVATVNVEIE